MNYSTNFFNLFFFIEGKLLYRSFLLSVKPQHESAIKWVKSLSHVQLFATPWTVGHQAPPSMGFPRQEYWSGLPFPSPGDLPNPRIKPGSPALQADALTSEPPGINIFPPFWTSLSSPSPSHPSRLIQSSWLTFLRHKANSHWLSTLHMVI